MANIGGNISAMLQKKVTTKNTIGESISVWVDYKTIWGFLDLSSGESKRDTYNAKVQESTHLFIMDYEPLAITESESRLICNGKTYEITLIDDPMYLHKHIEIMLKYTGD